MMNGLTELQMDIAASLWTLPATEEELLKRDFLKNRSPQGIYTMLRILDQKKWIYQKSGIYYCYRKTAKEILNKNGYELDITTDKRTEFEKAFDRVNKRF